MPVRPVFACEFCGTRPDDETQAALQRPPVGGGPAPVGRPLARSLGSTFGRP